MNDLSPENQKRLLKHQVLEAYSEAKKSNLIVAGLSVFVGFLGLHRFYLGQPVKGGFALIVGSYFLVGALYSIFGPPREFLIHPLEFLCGYGLFVGIESYLSQKATDRVNLNIRKTIETDLSKSH